MSVLNDGITNMLNYVRIIFMEQGRGIPSTEIPQSHWEAVAAVSYSGEDMITTMQALTAAERVDGLPYNLLLGGNGVALATRIRLYGGLGGLTDAVGTRVEEKQQDPRWLFAEAMALLEQQDNQ
jgi:hypothetical protein